ncbi:hypothetical protein Tcan_16845 [Toxocara canis]|uniref:Uncharacterized protein n=1 Tax=Toxocara canis TaxID=6265 RepID=A0A0B2UND1_TOXCA|nr:hypothetical protein Tcan_16845 [Toxocara canis]
MDKEYLHVIIEFSHSLVGGSSVIVRETMCHGLFGVIVASLVISISFSYPIYQFILNDSKTGVLLEFSRLRDPAQYDTARNSTAPVTVVILTPNPDRDFQLLRDAEAALSTQANFIYDNRESSKLSTPQLHVIVHQANSETMPGTVKFMIPLRKMNASSILSFIETSLVLERQIISPNIDKVLCVSDQQIVLMNSAFGEYKAFTMYISYEHRADNDLSEGRGLNSTEIGVLDLKPSIAKQILNPIRCELMFGASLIGIMHP